MLRFLICSWCLALTAIASFAQSNATPNILLIIADDVGVESAPCHALASPDVRMPNLAKLCEQGAVFENAYATPMCSSTRASIATGGHGFQNGVGSAFGWSQSNAGLNPSQDTIWKQLAANTNYATAVIGKWHLATQANGGLNHPAMAGVQHYDGVIDGNLDDYSQWTRTTNGVQRQQSGYITSVLTDAAIDWIERQDENPWFLWLAHTAPHTPFHAPPNNLHSQSLKDTTRDIRQNPRQYYLAMLEALDTEMGRLLDSMDLATRDNTVVIFLGDNGSPSRVVAAPFQRGKAKATLYQGGIHVPLVVQGTKHQGHLDRLVQTTDLYATILDLAGVQSALETSRPFLGLDHSRNFAFVDFFGAGGRARQAANYGWTVTDGRMKYLFKTESGSEELYNTVEDPGETQNLIGSIDPGWLREQGLLLQEQ